MSIFDVKIKRCKEKNTGGAANRIERVELFPAASLPIEAVTFGDAYELWIFEMKMCAKPNTVNKYEGIFNNHLFVLSDVELKSISRATVSQLTDLLLAKGLSNKTINDILIVFNMVLKSASDYGDFALPRINYLREQKYETRALTIIEQRRLSDYLCADMDVHKFGTLLAMYTGIRLGELCALRWEDIDVYSIKIDKTMMRVKNAAGKTEVVVAPPKSESSKRVIPISIDVLKHCVSFRGSGTGYVLSNSKLKYTEPRLMQYKFNKYASDCRLNNVTFHTLRHTFATRCIEAGVDAKTLSELLGHADTSITLNRYVHSSFELKKKSIKRMESLLA